VRPAAVHGGEDRAARQDRVRRAGQPGEGHGGVLAGGLGQAGQAGQAAAGPGRPARRRPRCLLLRPACASHAPAGQGGATRGSARRALCLVYATAARQTGANVLRPSPTLDARRGLPRGPGHVPPWYAGHGADGRPLPASTSTSPAAGRVQRAAVLGVGAGPVAAAPPAQQAGEGVPHVTASAVRGGRREGDALSHVAAQGRCCCGGSRTARIRVNSDGLA
jgi:hypothetical protein